MKVPKQNQCSIKGCRKEYMITLPNGKGLCQEHWEEHCEEKMHNAIDEMKRR